MKEELLFVRHLHVEFQHGGQKEEAVRDVSFDVGCGEIVGVVGESGSGKSTVMCAVLDVLPQDADVSYEQLWIRGGKSSAAMVFQDPSAYLNPTIKVGRQLIETILLHPEPVTEKATQQQKKNSRKRAWEHAEKLLEMTGIRNPEEIMKRYPFELSGGQQQRIVLAIALACRPSLLIADEPTTALDVTVQRQILDRLKRIAEETHTSVLLVSHDLGVVAALAKRILVMKDGEIIETGTAEEIFHEAKEQYTRELVEAARKHGSRSQDKRRISETILFQAEHLSFQYTKFHFLKKKSTEAVQDVSFFLRKGESYGLVGESGSGKTTLARMMTGIIEPSAGQILYLKERWKSLQKGRSKAQCQKIQMVFQNCAQALDPKRTIGEALTEPLEIRGGGMQDVWKTEAAETLFKVGLESEILEKYPGELSGGQRQRIGIARALMLKPELLVLDEPVSALDVTVQEQILQLLERLQREQELTYFFISHDLNVVRRICDRIGVLYNGRLVESGDAEQLYREPWHPYTKELMLSTLTADPKKMRRRRNVPELTSGGGTGSGEENGCPYADRCGYVMECCKKERPELYRFEDREVACFLYSEQHSGKRSKEYRMASQI
ncbi:ABC transporter ATP-binding protein [Mediterraneibacter glycyrrhizinilyticus]